MIQVIAGVLGVIVIVLQALSFVGQAVPDAMCVSRISRTEGRCVKRGGCDTADRCSVDGFFFFCPVPAALAGTHNFLWGPIASGTA